MIMSSNVHDLLKPKSIKEISNIIKDENPYFLCYKFKDSSFRFINKLNIGIKRKLLFLILVSYCYKNYWMIPYFISLGIFTIMSIIKSIFPILKPIISIPYTIIYYIFITQIIILFFHIFINKSYIKWRKKYEHNLRGIYICGRFVVLHAPPIENITTHIIIRNESDQNF